MNHSSTSRRKSDPIHPVRLTTFLTACFVFLSCSFIATAQQGKNQSPANDRETAESWVLKVGEERVSEGEFNQLLERRVQQAKQFRSKGKKTEGKQPEVNRKQMREQVKNQLVDRLVLQHHATSSGVSVSDEELDQKWNEVVNRFGSEQKLKSRLEKEGESIQDLRERMKESMLVEKFVEQKAEVDVTEDDVRSWYEQNKKRIGDRSFEDVKGPIKDMLKQQKIQQKRTEIAGKLKEKTDVKTNF